MTAQSEPSSEAIDAAIAVVEKYEDNTSQDEVAMIATLLDAFASARVKAEREQCAQVCERAVTIYFAETLSGNSKCDAARECAKWIRDRSRGKVTR